MKISLIGSGNVATNLAIGFHKTGHKIVQVYSQNQINAGELAQKTGSLPISSIHQLNPAVDMILVCVTDKAIQTVIEKIGFEPQLIAHTSGSIPMNTLSRFNNYGVFYPLQTFSKNRIISLTEVPICIEANSTDNKIKLEKLAKTITRSIKYLDSEERKQCHLSAVFANNFVNHFYVIAEQILKEKNISFELLKPLILETAVKVQSINPIEAQTGPAARYDTGTIETHLNELKSDKFEKLYRFVTESILETSFKQNTPDTHLNK